MRDERTVVFQIEAVIRGAKAKRGVRASVYMLAEENRAWYCDSEPTSFWCPQLFVAAVFHCSSSNSSYEGDDLHIRLNFVSIESALGFSAALNLWPMKGVDPLCLRSTIETCRNPKAVEVAELGNPVHLSDYKGADWDSPMQNLDEFRASVASLSLQGIPPTDPLVIYQSFEKPEKFSTFCAYKLHIKDKARFPGLANNENNMLAGSWTPFHQAFDSLNTTEDVPVLAIRPAQDAATADPIICPDGSTRFRVRGGRSSFLTRCFFEGYRGFGIPHCCGGGRDSAQPQDRHGESRRPSAPVVR